MSGGGGIKGNWDMSGRGGINGTERWVDGGDVRKANKCRVESDRSSRETKCEEDMLKIVKWNGKERKVRMEKSFKIVK